eukprot:766589-Hanusia_phi.AAC.1
MAHFFAARHIRRFGPLKGPDNFRGDANAAMLDGVHDQRLRGAERLGEAGGVEQDLRGTSGEWLRARR